MYPPHILTTREEPLEIPCRANLRGTAARSFLRNCRTFPKHNNMNERGRVSGSVFQRALHSNQRAS